MNQGLSEVVVCKQRGVLSSREAGGKRRKVDARFKGGGGEAVTLMCKRMSFEVENLGIAWHFVFYVLTCSI